MKKVILVLLALTLCAFFVSEAWAAEQEFMKGDMAYVCKSGMGCGRFEMATKNPELCKCGVEKDQLSVLRVEGNLVVLCSCGGGCVCDIHAKNPYKCSCDNPVRVLKILGM